MLPEAYVQHQTGQRVRLRIPAKKGDAAFFSDLQSKLTALPSAARIEMNPLTGSLLLCRDPIDIDGFSAFTEANQLFSVKRGRPSAPFAQKVAEPIGHMSRIIDRLSGGKADLPAVIFLSLLGFGFYEILRGNFKAPPWYTAFWYAFGVFSKSMLDRTKSETADPDSASTE